MDKLFAAIERLEEKQATHRSGWRLTDLSQRQIAEHLVEEALELYAAVLTDSSDADRLLEMGDLLACLAHLALRSKVTAERLEWAAKHKLEQRFFVTGNHPDQSDLSQVSDEELYRLAFDGIRYRKARAHAKYSGGDTVVRIPTHPAAALEGDPGNALDRTVDHLRLPAGGR